MAGKLYCRKCNKTFSHTAGVYHEAIRGPEHKVVPA